MGDPVSRISESEFHGVLSAFLVICLVASGVRFYIRICINHEVGWDDGFLLLGLCCLVSAMALCFTVIDMLYILENITFGEQSFIPLDLPAKVPNYHKVSTISLTLVWLSLCSVKFSFLAVFRKLINQIPLMVKYWWFAVIFNIIVTIVGIVSYALSYPYSSQNGDLQAISCIQRQGLTAALAYSIAHMTLDLASTLIIFVIPTYLTWKIRVRVCQKIALFFSFCLALSFIGITITRTAGIRWHEQFDQVWETFFTILAGEMGLILVAVVAFRTLFVGENETRNKQPASPIPSWLSRGTIVALNCATLFTKSRRSSSFSNLSHPDILKTEKTSGGILKQLRILFTRSSKEQPMVSNSPVPATHPEKCETLHPYPEPVYKHGGIKVEHEITTEFE